jgi:hypothetical protein
MPSLPILHSFNEQLHSHIPTGVEIRFVVISRWVAEWSSRGVHPSFPHMQPRWSVCWGVVGDPSRFVSPPLN